MFSGSECDPLDCDTPSLADECQHARKDVVSMFRVKVSRVLLYHHLAPTTKIENILSILNLTLEAAANCIQKTSQMVLKKSSHLKQSLWF